MWSSFTFALQCLSDDSINSCPKLIVAVGGVRDTNSGHVALERTPDTFWSVLPVFDGVSFNLRNYFFRRFATVEVSFLLQVVAEQKVDEAVELIVPVPDPVIVLGWKGVIASIGNTQI